MSGQSVPSEMSCNYLWDSEKGVGQMKKSGKCGGRKNEGERTGARRFLDATAPRGPACYARKPREVVTGLVFPQIPFRLSSVNMAARLLQSLLQLAGISEYCECTFRKFSMCANEGVRAIFFSIQNPGY